MNDPPAVFAGNVIFIHGHVQRALALLCGLAAVVNPVLVFASRAAVLAEGNFHCLSPCWCILYIGASQGLQQENCKFVDFFFHAMIWPE